MNEQNEQITTTETNTAPVVAEAKPKSTKKKTTKKTTKRVKGALNKECTKVLTTIVKNAGLTATEIRKKLRWGFTPTRALGFLRTNKFVLVDKKTLGYSVSAAGTAALAGAPTPKRRKVKTAPVVAADPIVGMGDAPAPVEQPALAEAAV